MPYKPILLPGGTRESPRERDVVFDPNDGSFRDSSKSPKKVRSRSPTPVKTPEHGYAKQEKNKTK